MNDISKHILVNDAPVQEIWEHHINFLLKHIIHDGAEAYLAWVREYDYPKDFKTWDDAIWVHFKMAFG